MVAMATIVFYEIFITKISYSQTDASVAVVVVVVGVIIKNSNNSFVFQATELKLGTQLHYGWENFLT